MRKTIVFACVCTIGCENKLVSTQEPDASDVGSSDVFAASDTPVDSSLGAGDSTKEAALDVAADAADGEVEDPVWTTGAGGPAFVATATPCGTSALSRSDLVFDSGSGYSARVFTHGDRVLVDGGRWVLWDRSTGNQVAKATELALTLRTRVGGNTFTTTTASALEIRDWSTGALRATVPVGTAGGVSIDGSYVWTMDGTGISFWSATTGSFVAKRPGSYDAVFAGASRFLATVGWSVDSIDPKTGATTTWSAPAPPRAYFSDESAITTAPLGIGPMVYGMGSATPLVTLPENTASGGFGNYAWVVTKSGWQLFDVRAPGGSMPLDAGIPWCGSTCAPVLSGSGDILSVDETGTRLVTARPGGFRSIDLTTSPPTTRDRDIDVLSPPESMFAEAADGNWAALQTDGALWAAKDGEPPVALGCGVVKSMAAADDGTVALATGSRVVILRVSKTGTLVKGYIPLASDYVALSKNGKKLGIFDEVGDEAGKTRLHIYDMTTLTPGPTLTADSYGGVGYRSNSWWNMSFDDAGDRLGVAAWRQPTQKGRRAVIDTSTGAAIRSWPVDASWGMEPIHLSPDGKRVALWRYVPAPPYVPGHKTDLIGVDDAKLVTIDGKVADWAGTKVILHRYDSENVYVSTAIADDSGAATSSWVDSSLDDTIFSSAAWSPARILPGDKLYFMGRVLDVKTGATVWPMPPDYSLRSALTADWLLRSNDELTLKLAIP